MRVADLLLHPIRSFVAGPGELAPIRAESRMSAYVYGEVLVLAAAAGVTAHELRSGAAVVVVLATVVSTYLAHVLADTVGAFFVGHGSWPMLRAEARDSLPVASAGIPVVVLFGAAELGWLPALFAQSVACTVVISRLAVLGVVYRRLYPSVRVRRAVVGGVLIAAVATAAAGLKLLLAH